MAALDDGLNPFVQVFYSNPESLWNNYLAGLLVLIPLFRSFILIRNNRNKEIKKFLGLNPFVQVFYSNCPILSQLSLVPLGLNPFVQVFYSNKSHISFILI